MRNGRAVALAVAAVVVLVVGIVTATQWWYANQKQMLAASELAKHPDVAAQKADSPKGKPAEAQPPLSATAANAPSVPAAEKKLQSAEPAAPKSRAAEKKQAAKPRTVPASRASAALPGGAPAQSNWEHWGRAKYAPSFEDACRTLHASIDGFSLPQPVKDAFKKKVSPNCENWTAEYLTPDMTLGQMWSGPDSKHRTAFLMERPKVAELPVVLDKDGKQYPRGSVFQAAKVATWTVEHGGNTYHLGIPFVCNNVAWWMGTPVAPQLACVRIEISPQVGDHIMVPIFTRRYLAASPCLKIIMGNREVIPAPCTHCDWSGFRKNQDERMNVPEGYKPFFIFSFIADSERVVISLPLEVMQGYLGICDTRNGIQSDGWLTRVGDWRHGQLDYRIRKEAWPTWNRADIGKEFR